MSFLPNDYEAPSKASENYMKINKGENKIRILSAPILGYEEWWENKPIRYRMNEKPLKTKDPECVLRHFWIFIVWNYVEEKIQILNLTQATLRKKIEVLSRDEDWREPYHYDVKIIKDGEGKETKYDVNPLPHKIIKQEIIDAFHAKPCNLEALFESLDPFAQGWNSYTSGVFNQETKPEVLENPKKSDKISEEQIKELNMIIEECSPGYIEKLMIRLSANSLKITKFSDITQSLYQVVKLDAQKNRESFIKEQQQKYENVNIDLGF